MENERLALSSLKAGCVVRLSADEGQYLCQGIVVESKDPNKLRLDKCRELSTNRYEEGVQEFYSEEIDEIEIISQPTEEKSPKSELLSQMKVKQNLMRQKKREEHPVEKPAHLQYYDQQHLKNLNKIQMKSLLDQEQIHPTPKMPLGSDEFGRFRFIAFNGTYQCCL